MTVCFMYGVSFEIKTPQVLTEDEEKELHELFAKVTQLVQERKYNQEIIETWQRHQAKNRVDLQIAQNRLACLQAKRKLSVRCDRDDPVDIRIGLI